MNAADESSRDHKEIPFLTARIVLWLALGLWGVSQCLPSSLEDPRPMWYFRDWQTALTKFGELTRAGRLDWEWWGYLTWIASFVSLIGAPLSERHLVKAPGLVRLLRPFIFAAGVYFAYLIYLSRDHLVFGTQLTTNHPAGHLAGFWWWQFAILLNLIGLWLIPTGSPLELRQSP